MMGIFRFRHWAQHGVCTALPALLFTAQNAAAQTAATAAPQSAAASASGFFQVLMGLVIVLGLLAAIAWMLKRFNISRLTGNAPVKIVGGVSVGNRERVVVVEVAGQWIVVGVAPGQVNALSTMPRPENAPSPEQATPQQVDNFSAWLKQKIDRRNAQ
ncbi:flagellar protein FliO/FliZ [Paucimonas lemoignei]|uniref:Flagellar protein n=1 Tax=Paucimonas lemoignei TaxID=29443 RepID=A0A4R3I0G6_PAULE|nr:flagellar biosynthetic protein FliO [Paucimonas lemoignei]TCS39177.1 flagellar protein FliO/FliZ [Paucimonas lemoignei]